MLLHENEAEIYGMASDRCKDILETINSPYLRAAFDFANQGRHVVLPSSS